MTVADFIREAANHDSCAYLTRDNVRELSELLSALRYDIDILREANEDFSTTNHELHADLTEAESGRAFALGTADLLLEQRDNLKRKLAQERQAVGVLTTALRNSLNEECATSDKLRTAKGELALADLRLAELAFERGDIDKWELDAAADHARKYHGNDLSARYREGR